MSTNSNIVTQKYIHLRNSSNKKHTHSSDLISFYYKDTWGTTNWGNTLNNKVVIIISLSCHFNTYGTKTTFPLNIYICSRSIFTNYITLPNWLLKTQLVIINHPWRKRQYHQSKQKHYLSLNIHDLFKIGMYQICPMN